MTVYKYFIKIALRNKGLILSYTIIFFILSIINGGTNLKVENAFIETKLNIGIIDNSRSELSRGLVEYVTSKNSIISMVEDEKYIREQVFLGQADAVIIIPKEFDERVLNNEETIQLYKDDRNIGAYKIENEINKYITFAKAGYENQSYNISDVHKTLDRSVEVEMIDGSENNDRINSWFQAYFNFTSYIILAIYIAVIGFVMIEFTEEEVENRRKVSSIRFLKFNREIYLGQLTIASLITAVFILGAIILKGKYINEVDFIKYLINTIVFSFSALCLVFLINNITNNRYVISGISTVISLGTSFISGVMVPQHLLGNKVLAIARFFPTYYFVKINNMDIASILDIKLDLLMQVLFAVVFFIMGLYFSRIKQRV